MILITFTGCATKLQKSNSILTSNEGAATIISQTTKFSDLLKPTFGLFNAMISTNLISIDGGSVKHAPKVKKNEYWVKPGKRIIEARCSIDTGKNRSTGRLIFEADLKKGMKYTLTAVAITTIGKTGKGTKKCKPVIKKR